MRLIVDHQVVDFRLVESVSPSRFRVRRLDNRFRSALDEFHRWRRDQTET